MFYNKIQPFLEATSTSKDISLAIKNRKKLQVANLNLSLKSLLVASTFRRENKSILVIVADDRLAEDFQANLEVLLSIDEVEFIPDYEVLPYEDRSPHANIRALRIRALSRILSSQQACVYVCSIRTLLRNLIPASLLFKNIKKLSVGHEYDPEILISELSGLGYNIDFQVGKVGQASKRGGIIDVYSPNHSLPLRAEFFGDEIETLRFFSPQTQKSEKLKISNALILPVREVSLHDVKANSPLMGKIAEEGFYQGIEQDVALLYENTQTLLDYFSNDLLLFWDEFQYVKGDTIEIFNEANQLFIRKQAKNKDQVLASPSLLFQDYDYIKDKLKSYQSIFLQNSQQTIPEADQVSSFTYLNIDKFNADFAKFEENLQEYIDKGYRIIVQSDNQSQSNRMKELLSDKENKIDFTIGVLSRGFILPEAKLALYTDHDIYNRYENKKYKSRFSKKESLVDYDSLNKGDYVVHIDHGIGIFEGLQKMPIDGNQIECLVINYAGGDKIYVPTFQIQLISKYIADEGAEPKVHKIGSKQWGNQKKKAKSQIEVIAQDIVNLYAERKMRVGVSHEPDSPWQLEMEESFLYDETADQLTTTAEIKADMESPTSMERLLCGDVGFGKTEVAIRACFKAVMSGYQVAVLVPTTLLAEQHYMVFRERLAQYPVKIAMLSRFRSPAKLKQDVIDISEGSVDIAIGTHRLLSKDVSFKRLGLLVVDEEHRFGVRQKEKIRQIKANVDTLYMSATPIPRTLSMALSKLKDISLIKTSPKDRLPVRTMVSAYDEEVIKDAIQREVDRGGQCFFLHNRVTTIKTLASRLEALLPRVRFRIGHGQMSGKELESLIIDFYHHKFDVLISTTIIENGIDIPNANTMIVNRADTFGLAQLYQIRGRVGRGSRRAYAYFLIPESVSFEARERLNALTEYDYLGAGYQIALRDLEIRGAGSLLGTKQSGTIKSVGFNYYNRLLREAMSNIDKNSSKLFDDNEKRENLEALKIRVDFYFPESYIADEKERINLYRRMKELTSVEAFEEIKEELVDRFGKMPKEALQAIQYFEMRFIAEQIGLSSCQIKNKKLVMEYPKQIRPKASKIKGLIKEITHPIKVDDTESLSLYIDLRRAAHATLLDTAIEILIKFLKIINNSKI
jgi:transcription-repair coupling factor (superfamily II helicase)